MRRWRCAGWRCDPREDGERGARRPRLIDAAGEVRGRLTARLLERMRLKERPSGCWKPRP